ncbi:hypothetical protein ACLKA7_016180 [Drosophila subpalustris]
MSINLLQIRAARSLFRNLTTLLQKNALQYSPQNQRMCSTANPPDAESLAVKHCYTFTDSQKELCLGDPSIADIVAQKTASKEFFYGIETKAMDQGKPACVDFNKFLPQLPICVSLVWTKSFSERIEETTMEYVPNIQLIRQLSQHIPAMPHLTVYRLNHKHLDDFLALKMNNVLVIRGDHVEEGQEYDYAYQAVEYLRKHGGKDLSIAVAGNPEGHPGLETGPPNLEKEMEYLKLKMDVGADFIVTQQCYSADKLVEFLKDARAAGITIPIVLGILIPETYARYERMVSFTNVVLFPDQLQELEAIKEDDAKVQEFFVQIAVHNIQKVLCADLGVSGIHFYTLNRMLPIYACISELKKLGIMNGAET